MCIVDRQGLAFLELKSSKTSATQALEYASAFTHSLTRLDTPVVSDLLVSTAKWRHRLQFPDVSRQTNPAHQKPPNPSLRNPKPYNPLSLQPYNPITLYTLNCIPEVVAWERRELGSPSGRQGASRKVAPADAEDLT